MTYLADHPDAKSLGEFYADYATYKGIQPAKPRQGSWRTGFRPAVPRMNPLLEGIFQGCGGLAGKSLCEIGCSVGDFLLAARAQGARVAGVEVDDAALKVLAQEGIPATRELPAQTTWDFICAYQVIEHLADPGGFIEGIGRALVPDGCVVLALPNGGESEVVGPPWVGFRVDLEHLNYFSVATLSRLLARHGIYVEQFWTCLPPNLPREGSPAVAPPRWQRWLRGQAAHVSAPPLSASGTYVLFVLARKAV